MTDAHWREAIERMRWGVATSSFQASHTATGPDFELVKFIVLAGLVPAIHAIRPAKCWWNGVGTRDKPAHDDDRRLAQHSKCRNSGRHQSFVNLDSLP